MTSWLICTAVVCLFLGMAAKRMAQKPTPVSFVLGIGFWVLLGAWAVTRSVTGA